MTFKNVPKENDGEAMPLCTSFHN